MDDTVELVEQADDRPLTDPIVVFDLETTGLNPVLETIIEIGAVKVQDGEVVDVFQTMVDPRRPIGAHDRPH